MVDPVTGHDTYRGWLSIPYLTPAGPVSIRFRRLDEGQPKYLSPPAQKNHLYNVGALHRGADTLAICEGELDALVMDAIVGIPAIGVPGVHAWEKHFPRVLEGVSRILIFADNDVKADGRNPGKEMATRLMEDLEQAVFVQLPAGNDVNELVIKYGVSFVRDLAFGHDGKTPTEGDDSE